MWTRTLRLGIVYDEGAVEEMLLERGKVTGVPLYLLRLDRGLRRRAVANDVRERHRT
jgi:hypothetical protein